MFDALIINQPGGDASSLLSILPHARCVGCVSPLDAVREYIDSITTEWFWLTTDTVDYSSFDEWDWIPPWHQSNHTHLWPSAYQIDSSLVRTGDTFLINRSVFQGHLKRGAVNIFKTPDLNVEHKSLSAFRQVNQFYMDWEGSNHIVEDFLPIPPFGDRIDVIRKIRSTNPGSFWLLESQDVAEQCVGPSLSASIIQFDNFSKWEPEWDQRSHLHVWPSIQHQHGGTVIFVHSEANLTDPFWNFDHTPIPVFPNFTTQIPFDSFDNLLEVINHGCLTDRSKWILFYQRDLYNKRDAGWFWPTDWSEEEYLYVWNHTDAECGNLIAVNRLAWLRDTPTRLLDYKPAITWKRHTSAIPQKAERYHADTTGSGKGHRYFGTHTDMIRRAVSTAKSEYVWVTCNHCDYSDFDWSWRPDWKDYDALHVWPTGDQKYGDTFLVHVRGARDFLDSEQEIDQYPNIKWHQYRLSSKWPIAIYHGDLRSEIERRPLHSLYTHFFHSSQSGCPAKTPEADCWQKRPLYVDSRNVTNALVPRDAKPHVSHQVQDYHNILWFDNPNRVKIPQDIVFISYNELDASKNWEALVSKFPRAHRISGVKGIDAATRAAALFSKNSPWFYAVFPKTTLHPDFNFDYEPDQLESPRNYVFYAHNPTTGLTYGHGGVVLYHRDTVINLKDPGFDFTMSMPLDTVPVVSCTINYGSEFEAWRTAYRECLKLRLMNTIESEYRLSQWLENGYGIYGDASRRGAKESLDHRNTSLLANDWEWLKARFDEGYSE